MGTDFASIGKYKILGKIGSGAMGEVFKALDPGLNRHVAIKTISAALDADDDIRKRFIREAQSAARLNHPNIITVYESGEEHGKIFMAMELLEGTDLKEMIASRALTGLSEKLAVIEQLCDGLAFAHAKEIIHRDLKPSNIHVQPDGHVKIMDFGLARIATSEMTRTGTVMGTPNYMSPEQVRGEKATARSDVFSLGVLFYELLSAHKAFDADTMHGVLFQVLDGEAPPISNWVPDLPQIVIDVVERAMAKDPAERFADGGEFRAALRAVRRVLDEDRGDEATLESEMGEQLSQATIVPVPGQTVVPRPHKTPTGRPRASSGGRRTRSVPAAPVPAPPPPSRLPLIAGVGAVLVLGVGLAYWFGGHRETVTPPPATVGDAKVSALTELLVKDKLESARRALADKDYKEAQSKAASVLALDPGNAEAKQLLDKAQGTLQELEAAASKARTAFDAGDTAGASEALAKVLAIDPSHPVATELSKRLNKFFQGQAQDARKLMAAAKTAATTANADSLPPFVEAAGLARDADAMVKGSEFVTATQKYLQARDGFERALRMAEKQTKATPPPTTVAAVTLAPATLPPATTAPAATPPPATAAPATTAPGATEDPAVRRVLADYARAIEQKDMALFKAIKPGLSKDEEKRLADAFKAIKTQQVNLTVNSVEIAGQTARVRVSRRDTINGKAVQGVEQMFTLAKGPGGWTIQSIGQ